MEIIILAIVALIILVPVGWLAWNLWKVERSSKLLREQGVEISATVVKRAVSGDADQQHTYYSLTVKYVVNGTTYQQSIGVQENAYNTFPEGSDVDIIYLPDNPKVIALKHLF
jgi:uncharacterized protein YpmB